MRKNELVMYPLSLQSPVAVLYTDEDDDTSKGLFTRNGFLGSVRYYHHY